MKIFRFDAEVGKAIDLFGSRGVIQSRLIHSSEPLRIGCFYVSAGGVAGYHQTVKNQLFALVQGAGAG